MPVERIRPSWVGGCLVHRPTLPTASGAGGRAGTGAATMFLRSSDAEVAVVVAVAAVH